MSKSNMLLGLAKGKVGDLVFYRDGGEQRTRTRVVPKNPRTIAQMAQRVKIANVSGIYRAAAAILSNSFSNRPSNQSGYNAFAKGAIGNAPYLTKQQAAAGVVLPQPAMMSRGVLQSVPYANTTSEEFRGIGIAAHFTQFQARYLGDMAKAISAQYPDIIDGDELNFVTLKFTPIENVEGEVDVYNVAMSVDTLVIDSSSTEDIVNTGFLLYGDVFSAKQVPAAEEDAVYMQFIVHSRVDANGILSTSTQWAELSSAAQSLYDGYRTEQALTDAVESYKATATPILR